MKNVLSYILLCVVAAAFCVGLSIEVNQRIDSNFNQVLAALKTTQVAPAASTSLGGGVNQCEAKSTGCAALLLQMMNRDRAAHGTFPLTMDPNLTRKSSTCLGAKGNAQSLAAQGEIGHPNFPNDVCPPWTTAEENVGYSPQSNKFAAAVSIFDLMAAEPTDVSDHHSNWLCSCVNRVGIGFAYRDGFYLSEDFAQVGALGGSPLGSGADGGRKLAPPPPGLLGGSPRKTHMHLLNAVTPVYAKDRPGLNLAPIINWQAHRYGLSAVGILAVAMSECNLFTSSVTCDRCPNAADCSFGATQETVATAAQYGVGTGSVDGYYGPNESFVRNWENDPRNSIRLAAKILASFRKICRLPFPDLDTCWNAGPGQPRWFLLNPTGQAGLNHQAFLQWYAVAKRYAKVKR